MFDKINMQKRIFQGDYLSPLLFCISPKPLSLELNSWGYGYKIRTEQISFLFYMDDLKLYAKDDSEFEGFLRIVKVFSDDIGMGFGLSTYTKGRNKRRARESL